MKVWWYFRLHETSDLVFCCPLFLLWISIGGKDTWKHTYWWGFSFNWKRNKEAKEGDLLFFKEYRFVFREYPHWKAVQHNGCPL